MPFFPPPGHKGKSFITNETFLVGRRRKNPAQGKTPPKGKPREGNRLGVSLWGRAAGARHCRAGSRAPNPPPKTPLPPAPAPNIEHRPHPPPPQISGTPDGPRSGRGGCPMRKRTAYETIHGAINVHQTRSD